MNTENIGYRSISPELLLCHRLRMEPIKRVYHPQRVADNYEIILVQDKPDIHSVNDKEYFAYPEDIIFIKPGDRVHSYSYGTNYNIVFCFMRYPKEKTYGCDFIDGLRSHHIIADADKDKYADITRSIFECFETEDPDVELRAKSLIIFLLQMLCKDGVSKDKYIKNSMRYIDENICQSTSVEEIVNNSGISNAHYHRLFKEVNGITPVEYINRKKMKIAREIIESSNQSDYEISKQLGFFSVAYFRRLFKDTYGSTPAEYIKNFKDL